MKTPLIVLVLGVLAFGVAVLVEGGVGDVLSIVGMVLIGAGALMFFGRLYQDNWDRMGGSGPDSRHEMNRGVGPF